MDSNEILRRQNEEQSLRIQYAARNSFNTAEKYNGWAWLACLVAAFSLIFPNAWPAYVLNGIPLAADICAAILSFCACTKVKWASMLRKYFDAYVLDLQRDQYSETDRREVLEYTEKICRKHPDDLAIQMANTGYDSPPGLRDWYVFSGYYIGTKAQLECQRQNTWWNKKIVEKRLLLTVILTVLLALVFWLLLMHYNKLTVVFCSAGVIIKIAERIVENGRYLGISKEIDGALKAVETNPSKKGVLLLQELIDQRRSINVLESAWVHKKLANELSEMYDRIKL